MRTRDTILLCFVTAALLCGATCNYAISPKFCCFNFFGGQLHRKHVSKYLVTDNRCWKAAVILVTNKSRRFCVHKEQPWVQKILRSLDQSNI